MIIELFGPPGVGKTTFARTLAARLREHGHATELMLSYRPAEQSNSPDSGERCSERRQTAATLRRLVRPIVEMLAMERRPRVISNDIGAAMNLIKILPPKDVIWSIRLKQYLTRLAHSWNHASGANHIVLFDQAFVQAVCSLVLLGRVEDRALISHALDFMPNSDLLVRLDAPQEVLEGRLRDRERRQSVIERLLELDLKRNLELMGIVNRLHLLLRERDRPVTRVSSIDVGSLREAAERIEEQAKARFSAKCREST